MKNPERQAVMMNGYQSFSLAILFALLFSPQEEKVQSSEVKPRGFSVLSAKQEKRIQSF